MYIGLPWWLRWERICLQCRRLGFDPWVGISPGEGNGYPLQYPCLGNPMYRGAWKATGHEHHKELDMTERLTYTHTHVSMFYPALARICMCTYVQYLAADG